MKLRHIWQRLRPRPAPWPLVRPSAPAAAGGGEAGPLLSVIVVCYKMEKQIQNTLRSLIPPYQRDVQIGDYEVRVVDNGSPQPLAENVWKLAPNIHYQYVSPDQAHGNPGVAINRAVAGTRSKLVCVMIDGARMLTPGILHWGISLASFSPRTLVEVRSWHLGPKCQTKSVSEGYNSEVEQRLLEQINWPSDGYRLFEISEHLCLNGRGGRGLLGPVPESNCLFMSRELFDDIGGYDERYQTPGGGLVNMDFYHRASRAADCVFTMLGEGTFHQIHGGASTGLVHEKQQQAFRVWRGEYERISRPWRWRSREFGPRPILAGHTPKEFLRWMVVNPQQQRGPKKSDS